MVGYPQKTRLAHPNIAAATAATTTTTTGPRSTGSHRCLTGVNRNTYEATNIFNNENTPNAHACRHPRVEYNNNNIMIVIILLLLLLLLFFFFLLLFSSSRPSPMVLYRAQTVSRIYRLLTTAPFHDDCFVEIFVKNTTSCRVIETTNLP